MSDRRKNKSKHAAPASGNSDLEPLPPAEKYSGQLSRQLATEMLEHAIRHLHHYAPDPSWSDIDNHCWYGTMAQAVETLSQRAQSLRPNIRRVLLPQLRPDQPGSAFREFEYCESATGAVEVISEILETAEDECGKEFAERLRRAIVNQLRRSRAPRLAKPKKELNLETIGILKKLVEADPQSESESLKELAPPKEDPLLWAHDMSIQLNRFCERAYRVWQQFPDIPIERIDQARFVPNAKKAFRLECSLEFPNDEEIAREAIKRGEKLTDKRNRRKLLQDTSRRAGSPK